MQATKYHLALAKSLAALDAWIAVRLRCCCELSNEVEYRGLRLGSKLIFSHKGQITIWLAGRILARDTL